MILKIVLLFVLCIAFSLLLCGLEFGIGLLIKTIKDKQRDK